MKAILLSLSLALLVSVASSAALTAGNLLVLRKSQITAQVPYSRVYVDEITTSGTLVQTFDPNCVLQFDYSGGLAFNQDFTSAAFACFPNNGNPDLFGPKIVVAIQSNGTMDTTTISDALLGLDPLCAFVDGRSVFVGSDSSIIVYARRNGDVILPNAVTTPTNTILDLQMQGNTFYIGGYETLPFFIASVVGGLPKTISDIKNVVTGSNLAGFGGEAFNRFFVYSPTEIYATEDNGRVAKFTLSDGWSIAYRTPYFEGALGLVVDTVAGKRMVYVATTIGKSDVLAFEDDGTQFLNQVTIKSYATSVAIQDLLYIRAPTGACGDGSKNLDETDVDCGGYSCGLCANTKGCLINDDCVSAYCNPNSVCSVPSCQDTFKNQDETDADCGGNICSKRCNDGSKCFMDSDCFGSYCNPAKKCSTPSCVDGFLNQDETDVDCGGNTCGSCVVGQKCRSSADCASEYCNPLGRCSVPTCNDTFVNQDETDVDCGGVACRKCDIGLACKINADCTSNSCTGIYCNEAYCLDGEMNGQETDVDCGGNCDAKCGDGKGCLLNTDCLSQVCDNNNKCAVPSCNDNVQNQNETDVDCGGECSGCDVGKTCKQNSDCNSNVCDNFVCIAKTPSPSAGNPTPDSNSTPTPSGKSVSGGTKLIGASNIIALAILCVILIGLN